MASRSTRSSRRRSRARAHQQQQASSCVEVQPPAGEDQDEEEGYAVCAPPTALPPQPLSSRAAAGGQPVYMPRPKPSFSRAEEVLRRHWFELSISPWPNDEVDLPVVNVKIDEQPK